MINALNIDWLIKNHNMIHFFGLGFIQIKLNQYTRVHVYSNELESFVEHPHNHRYNFISTVLKGSIENHLYQKIKGTKFIVQKDNCSENNTKNFDQELCDFKLLKTQTINANQNYYMNHEIFHTVQSNNCITFLERSDYCKELADISYLNGQEKICPFSKKISDNDLWEIVKQSLMY